MAIEDLSTGLMDRAKSRVGSVLREKWRLDRLLGIGGMAAVYAATHRNGSRGAIKMLHTELSIDAEVKRRFLREGYVANAVDHPGTVKVLDDDAAEDGSVFIVMELLEGETLEARCERRGGRIPPAELIPLVDQLLDVLAAAHARGVVHRDIKPENVFVTSAGVVKLLDFGIARLRRHQGSLATVTGATFGTPAFMPPEQALGRTEQVEARSDLWSVGATLFNLLSGRVVHVTETLNEQLVAHAAMPAPSLASAAPSLPPALVAAVDRAMAYDKSGRWQTAAEMQQALRRVLAEGLSTAASGPAMAPTVAMPVFGAQGGATTGAPERHSYAGPPTPRMGAPQAGYPVLQSGAFPAQGSGAFPAQGSGAFPAQGSPALASTGQQAPARSAPMGAPAGPYAAQGAPAPGTAHAPHPPVAPSVTSVTSVQAMSGGGFAPQPQGPLRRGQVLVGAAVGAVMVLVIVLVGAQRLRGSPAAVPEPLPTATAAPGPAVVPAPADTGAAEAPSAAPAASTSASAAPSITASAQPAAPTPPAPTPTVAATAQPSTPKVKPSATPSATPRAGKAGDWLDRQH